MVSSLILLTNMMLLVGPKHECYTILIVIAKDLYCILEEVFHVYLAVHYKQIHRV